MEKKSQNAPKEGDLGTMQKYELLGPEVTETTLKQLLREETCTAAAETAK